MELLSATTEKRYMSQPEGQGWLSEGEEAILLASKDENASNTPPLRRRYVRRFLAWAWEWI